MSIVYPQAAVERAMKIQEVLLKAMSGELKWWRAAEILGCSERSMRRYRMRVGHADQWVQLIDRRRRRPSPKRAPAPEAQRILKLYRDRYRGFNVRHFHDLAKREHGVVLSYSFVKQLLQAAGLAKKQRARGRHRLRRERRACFGEMLHLDGSPHVWLALVPDERQTMIAIPDDATSRVLYAQLHESESTDAVLSGLWDVISTHGLPMALYTDRAAWAFFTKTAGGKVDKEKLTQVGRALKRLGIEHIPSYSPQGRGRGERLNRTLQDRLVNELRVAGIRTVEAANRYLRERFIPEHNKRFACQPRDPETAFVPVGDIDLDQVLCHQNERVVGEDNVVSFDGVKLQLGKQPGRRSCAGMTVVARRHVDGTHTVWRGSQLLGRYDRCGRRIEPRAAKAA
jgi:hypothetical protein